MGLKEALKNGAARLLAALLTRRVRDFLCHEPYFRLWEEKGLHITPVHFYQPIPDTAELDRRGWDRVSELPGLDMNGAGQLALLEELSGKYRSEYSAFPAVKPAAGGFYTENGTFESVDCEIYYSMIRRAAPAAILEVGGGNSTLLAAAAALANKEGTGRQPSLTVIEPYPGPELTAGFPGLAGVITEKAEDAPLDLFTALGPGDILFIDSSHALKTGGDVQQLYLEVLPRLKKGVLVHIHDIFLPLDYPRDTVVGRRRFWNEQYLVQAFLAFNSSFRVLWCSAYMNHRHPDKLAAAFPSYGRAPRRPGSLWLERTA